MEYIKFNKTMKGYVHYNHPMDIPLITNLTETLYSTTNDFNIEFTNNQQPIQNDQRQLHNENKLSLVKN